MNKQFVKFAAFVVVFLLMIFLYKKYQTYEDYFVIVPNSVVSTHKRSKKYFDIHPSSFDAIFSPDTAPIPSPITAYTNLSDIPPSSTSGVSNGLNYNLASDVIGTKIYIYNPGVEDFKIFGISLSVLPRTSDQTKTKTISMIWGPRSKNIINKYQGNQLSLPYQNEIEFINSEYFIITRLIIICDNLVTRPLIVYLKNSSNQYKLYKISSTDITVKDLLTDTIIVANLFDS